MKVLITGFTGFVGRYLTSYLNTDPQMHLTGMTRNLKLTDSGFKAKAEQVLTKAEVIKHFEYDTIIHLAGKAHDLKINDDEREYFRANEKLTIELFDAFIKSPSAKKFIFISTVSVFEKGSEKPYTESDKPNPSTPYGISKLNAENYIREQTLPPGKTYYILRPSIIYGPGNKGNLVLLYRFLKKGIPYPLGSYENQRSFLSVENLSYILQKLCYTKVSSGIYHIADNEVLSTLDVIRIIDEAVEQKIRVLRITPGVIKLLAQFGDYLPIPFDTEKLEKLTQSFVISNQKLKNALKTDLPVNTFDGLNEMFISLETDSEKLV
ncbi:MAG: NAD-dependent epimerase/dehydratase family protein [Cyclobacteriaceae bacterium]|nr:NAD-dependent epimerase/dehydratase family protein [Cyclobacteriaceae bacterium]